MAAAPLTLGSATAVAMMVTVPPLTPRTNPAESTVAIVSRLELHRCAVEIDVVLQPKE